MMDHRVPLSGLKVLILEDETLISMLIENIILDLGSEVVGPFLKVSDTLRFLEAGEQLPDAAILDVNVAGERSYAVAEHLTRRGIPFVFSTGYDQAGLDEPWRLHHCLRKPYSPQDLEDALRAILARTSA